MIHCRAPLIQSVLTQSEGLRIHLGAEASIRRLNISLGHNYFGHHGMKPGRNPQRAGRMPVPCGGVMHVAFI